MEAVAEHELSVVLSSHLVSDLERVCDHLIVLVDSRVRLAGDVDALLATHHRLTGPRRDPPPCRPTSTSSPPATPTGRPRCWSAPTPRSTTPPGPSASSASRTSSWPTWARPRPKTTTGPRWRCCDDLADLAAVPRPGRVMAAALAALAVVLVLTGPAWPTTTPPGSPPAPAERRLLELRRPVFQDHRGTGLAVTAVVLVLPALIGVFWGAPLIARELEAGTHRLVWNQSITRTRWLAVKLGLVGLAAVTAAGLRQLRGGLVVRPDRQGRRRCRGRPRAWTPLLFGARGIVPIGYAAFAFALGVTVGMLVRRTVPAMAITLAVFVARPDRHAATGPAPPHPAQPLERRDHRVEPGRL